MTAKLKDRLRARLLSSQLITNRNKYLAIINNFTNGYVLGLTNDLRNVCLHYENNQIYQHSLV